MKKALEVVAHKDHALDIGAGALNDSVFLLQSGFAHVTALDKEPVAEQRAQKISLEVGNRFTYVTSGIEDFDFAPNTYDFINASYVLPFAPATSLPHVLPRIIASLTEGGVFVGQFLGEYDAWKGSPTVTTHTEAQAHDLLKTAEILHFTSQEEDKTDTTGTTKHWHVYHFIVRRTS